MFKGKLNTTPGKTMTRRYPFRVDLLVAVSSYFPYNMSAHKNILYQPIGFAKEQSASAPAKHTLTDASHVSVDATSVDRHASNEHDKSHVPISKLMADCHSVSDSLTRFSSCSTVCWIYTLISRSNNYKTSVCVCTFETVTFYVELDSASKWMCNKIY